VSRGCRSGCVRATNVEGIGNRVRRLRRRAFSLSPPFEAPRAALVGRGWAKARSKSPELLTTWRQKPPVDHSQEERRGADFSRFRGGARLPVSVCDGPRDEKEDEGPANKAAHWWGRHPAGSWNEQSRDVCVCGRRGFARPGRRRAGQPGGLMGAQIGGLRTACWRGPERPGRRRRRWGDRRGRGRCVERERGWPFDERDFSRRASDWCAWRLDVGGTWAA